MKSEPPTQTKSARIFRCLSVQAQTKWPKSTRRTLRKMARICIRRQIELSASDGYINLRSSGPTQLFKKMYIVMLVWCHCRCKIPSERMDVMVVVAEAAHECAYWCWRRHVDRRFGCLKGEDCCLIELQSKVKWSCCCCEMRGVFCLFYTTELR